MDTAKSGSLASFDNPVAAIAAAIAAVRRKGRGMHTIAGASAAK